MKVLGETPREMLSLRFRFQQQQQEQEEGGAGARGWQMCDVRSDDLRVPRKPRTISLYLRNGHQHIPNPLGIKRSSVQRMISLKKGIWKTKMLAPPTSKRAPHHKHIPNPYWNGMVFKQNFRHLFFSASETTIIVQLRKNHLVIKQQNNFFIASKNQNF